MESILNRTNLPLQNDPIEMPEMTPGHFLISREVNLVQSLWGSHTNFHFSIKN